MSHSRGAGGGSGSSASGSRHKRRSIFALSPLSSVLPSTDSKPRTLKKQARSSTSGNVFAGDGLLVPPPDTTSASSDSPKGKWSDGNASKKSERRTPSRLDSLRSITSNFDHEAPPAIGEPLSATSTKAFSWISYPETPIDGYASYKNVFLHGEVQTSAGMFWRKKEYLILTENHLLRYKSQAKAAEVFNKVVPHPSTGKSPTTRHSSMPSMGSAGSTSDVQTVSDSSGEKIGRMSLRQVIAIHILEDSKASLGLEVCCLDDYSQASIMTLQLSSHEERDIWLKNIRMAVAEAKSNQIGSTLPVFDSIAQLVERDHDYSPDHFDVYKVAQPYSLSKGGEDVTKTTSTMVCYLVIGLHKVHVIQNEIFARASGSSLTGSARSHISFGILTLVNLKVSNVDDTFELTFRKPLQKPRSLLLSSHHSKEIAARLHAAENYLRPECGHRLFRFTAPADVDKLLAPPPVSDEEHSCLDRTLSAYCIAYGVNPSNVRYYVNHECEDAPRFELLPPADLRRPDYDLAELLAIMRALRYNESFGSISLVNIRLDCLKGVHDTYGFEHVCSHTKRGTPIRLSSYELTHSSLLVQEVRALAATSKKLRRMDFSGAIVNNQLELAGVLDEDNRRAKDIGCGIVEALFPLCKHQTTNVDWICLNGISLSETDLDYLIAAAAEKPCHFRAIELNRCDLNDRSLGLILDALRAQDNTLEALEIAGNAARLNPSTFDSQLGMFGFIRVLNLSNVSRTSGAEPLLTSETLLIWRLQELRLSGTALNAATVHAVATYLAHPQSKSLHELDVANCYLTGSEIAVLMRSMTWNPDEARDLHLDISQNHLSKGLDEITQAIASGYAPSKLTMRAVEYREEWMFRKMIAALTPNKTTRLLDMSSAALPGDASEETCRALQRLLEENDVLIQLDWSGEDFRLATSRYGAGLNQALLGLKKNHSLQRLRVENQKLGLQGASSLADVLKENRTLRELHCDNNEIPLQGLTDLVNALIENTTLVFLPTMNDGRATAFKSAELTMKGMADLDPKPSAPASPSSPSRGNAMKRSIASVRKTATRSAAVYSPSFPALPSVAKSGSPPDSRLTSPSLLALPRARQSFVAPVPSSSFTVQDIHTTHRLLSEQWDRQCFRLSQYLERNWALLQGFPANMEIEDEKFERPSSAATLGRMTEHARLDAAPAVDLDLTPDSSFLENDDDNNTHKKSPVVGVKAHLRPTDRDSLSSVGLATNRLSLLDFDDANRTATPPFLKPPMS